MGARQLNEIRTGSPQRIGGVTLLPLEEWTVVVRVEGRRVFAHGNKRAIGIVIQEEGRTRAVDLTGDPLDMNDLRGRAAGLGR